MTVQTTAAAVDTALTSLDTALASLVTATQAKDATARNQTAANHPHPIYEDIVRTIRHAAASKVNIAALLMAVPRANPVATLASMFPAGD